MRPKWKGVVEILAYVLLVAIWFWGLIDGARWLGQHVRW
jgi:hypothetical protein